MYSGRIVRISFIVRGFFDSPKVGARRRRNTWWHLERTTSLLEPSVQRVDRRPMIKVAVADNLYAYIEVGSESAKVQGTEAPSGRQVISSFTDRTVGQFRSLADSIRAVASDMRTAIDAVAPSEAEIEFGVEAKVETDGLTALIVKGEGSANFKVRLKWVRDNE